MSVDATMSGAEMFEYLARCSKTEKVGLSPDVLVLTSIRGLRFRKAKTKRIPREIVMRMLRQ